MKLLLETDVAFVLTKGYVDTLVRKAYDNWMHVIEYDSKCLLSQNQDSGPGASQAEFPSGPHDHSSSMGNQLPMPSLQTQVAVEQPYMDSGQGGGGTFSLCGLFLSIYYH